MESDVTLLYWEDLNSSELNVKKIAEFLGGTIKLVQLTREALVDEESLRKLVSGNGCLIASAQTLFKASNQKQGRLGWQRLLTFAASNVLVYGFEPIPGHGLVLQELTSGAFSGVEPLGSGASEFNVDKDPFKICRQFAGLSFGTVDPDTNFTFIEAKKSRYTSLIRIGQKPFFVCANDHGRQILLLATQRIEDLDATVPSNTSILQFFSGLVPLMMFLFSASPNGFWHNDSPNACFIVDDPLLKRRYGFLDYRKLLEIMEREGFCTSIAFIPWNCRRSSRRIAELFAAYPHRYSLCVHGCGHTAGEFGSTNNLLLEGRAQKALDQMTVHQQLSGLSFDEIMVFPQGVFSTAAIKALKSCGYLAAVNSTLHPVDVEGNTLTLRELLEGAVTRYSNFPIFIRRYPKNIAESAFDLFLGKPCLLVEHHAYFREGYGALTDVVRKLNALDEPLAWAGLEEICSHACLERVAENGNVHVRFYTDTFRLQNATERPQNYMLFRRTAPKELLAGVTINGVPTAYSQDGEYVKIELSMDAGQTAEVCLKKDRGFVNSWHERRMHSPKVLVRRRLCEFRDNYVQRSKLLHRMASTAANILQGKKRNFRS